MKSLIIVTASISLSLFVGFASGYRAGSLDQGAKLRDQIEESTARAEALEDEFSFRQAQKVSRITGVDLYQVVTGRKPSLKGGK